MKLLLLLLLLCCGLTVSAQTKEPDYDHQNWYVYLLELRDPAMASDGSLWTEADHQALKKHVANFQTMLEQGTLILAGPCDNGKGPGLVVYRANSLKEAIEIRDRDPAVQSGLMTATVYPFSPAFMHGDPHNTHPPVPQNQPSPPPEGK